MPDRARLKILVVEDDSIDREFLRRALKEARSVHEAATAVEAEKLFKEEDFDCVLLDYRIPDGGELDLLPKFVDKGVPVIVMTGLGSETTAVQVRLRNGLTPPAVQRPSSKLYRPSSSVRPLPRPTPRVVSRPLR